MPNQSATSLTKQAADLRALIDAQEARAAELASSDPQASHEIKIAARHNAKQLHAIDRTLAELDVTLKVIRRTTHTLSSLQISSPNITLAIPA